MKILKHCTQLYIKLKNYIVWGVFDLNEIITNEKLYNWFYCSDDFDYSAIKC